MLDTTLRPICFGIPNDVKPEVAKTVGAEKFKRYEYALYVCAQLSRIVYADSGIIWHILKDSFGKNNDIVNMTITKYDKMFLAQKRMPISSQAGEPGTSRPPESYSLVPSDGTNPYGVYISSPSDCTVLFVKATQLSPNPNSPFLPTDLFITFKGSSTLKNFKHDLMSQFSAGKLISIASEIINNDVGKVTLAFVKPILKAWKVLIKGLEDFTTDGCRLFLTGHSLGGAYTSLFAFILAEAKLSGKIPVLNKVKSIHIVTFGAPTILSGHARNEFNKHLDSGFLTLDRVVSQAVAARSAVSQIAVGGIMGPNDVIPSIPVGFNHPGFTPGSLEYRPEANGRPYQMQNIRSFYGAPSKTNYRDPTTWPFPQFTEISEKEGKEDAATTEELKELEQVKVEESKGEEVQVQEGGGLFDAGRYKAEYDRQTKMHIPNFVSVLGSKYAFGFAHAEYLGLFFLGGFRLYGMKNPASTSLAYFYLNDKGVKINYFPTTDRPEPGQEGAGRTRRIKARKLKHKNRKNQHKRTRKN